MSASKPSLWKTILFPPLFALLLYLLAIYIVIPLYHRLLPSRQTSWLSALPSRLSSRLSSSSRRRRSGESLLGDEELEEGLLDDQDVRPPSGREAVGGHDDSGVGGEGGRLSRELEVGFRDESDEEEKGEEEQRGRRGRR